jgi:hypothetical protein
MRKTAILESLKGQTQSSIIGMKNWDIPEIYSLYCEYMETGQFPYHSSVVKFIIEKEKLSLSIEDEEHLKSHVYMASHKFRDDQNKLYEIKMLSAGWLVLNNEITQKAIDGHKKIILDGKKDNDFMTSSLSNQKPYRPIKDQQGQYFLIAPGKRNRGYFVRSLMQPYNDYTTFCKLM